MLNFVIDILSSTFKNYEKIQIEIDVSWLNPEKVRKILIITSKKILLFDELNYNNPIQIFNNYTKYPELKFFSKKYFSKIHKFNLNKNLFLRKNVKFKNVDSLGDEITSFVKNKKNIADIKFAEKVLIISKKLI